MNLEGYEEIPIDEARKQDVLVNGETRLVVADRSFGRIAVKISNDEIWHVPSDWSDLGFKAYRIKSWSWTGETVSTRQGAEDFVFVKCPHPGKYRVNIEEVME